MGAVWSSVAGLVILSKNLRDSSSALVITLNQGAVSTKATADLPELEVSDTAMPIFDLMI